MTITEPSTTMFALSVPVLAQVGARSHTQRRHGTSQLTRHVQNKIEFGAGIARDCKMRIFPYDRAGSNTHVQHKIEFGAGIARDCKMRFSPSFRAGSNTCEVFVGASERVNNYLALLPFLFGQAI